MIEPMVSEQWFVRTEGMGAAALAAVKTDRMQIIPQRFAKIYNNWMEGIQDWCISRQLWWGHRIPVWYCFASASEAEAARGRGDQFVVAHNEEEARQKVCCCVNILPAVVCFIQALVDLLDPLAVQSCPGQADAYSTSADAPTLNIYEHKCYVGRGEAWF